MYQQVSRREVETVNFSDFIKMGGHTFNLLQNKELMELFGMAKDGYKKIQESQKNQSSQNSQSSQPAKFPMIIPHHYPIPIDSPYWKGTPYPPYGMYNVHHRPYGTLPPGYPFP
jgi:hypothetical protein